MFAVSRGRTLLNNKTRLQRSGTRQTALGKLITREKLSHLSRERCEKSVGEAKETLIEMLTD